MRRHHEGVRPIFIESIARVATKCCGGNIISSRGALWLPLLRTIEQPAGNREQGKPYVSEAGTTKREFEGVQER